MSCIDCSNCKAYCCKAILKLFPYLEGNNDYCKFLTDDYKCSIYANRPTICQTNKMHPFTHPNLSWDEYEVLSKEACNKLKDIYEV